MVIFRKILNAKTSSSLDAAAANDHSNNSSNAQYGGSLWTRGRRATNFVAVWSERRRKVVITDAAKEEKEEGGRREPRCELIGPRSSEIHIQDEREKYAATRRETAFSP